MKKRVLCFGDSNTWGAVPIAGNRYSENVRWTGVLQDQLGEGYQVIEEGYNGRTSVFEDTVEGRWAGIKYFSQCIDSQSPLDLVIIMLGTNDLKTRYGVEARTIAFGFNRYVDALSITPMDGGKPQVLLMSPILIDPSYKDYPLFHDMFGERADERSMKLADAYREFAESAGWEFLDASKYAEASKMDGVHMEPEGHKSLGAAVAVKVREMLD